MYYHAASDVLWVLCGTETNGNHYLYAYSTSGAQKCAVTIPQAVGMSRVDGFYIVDSKAYIVDSQGPLYAATIGKLGGSVYEVDWTNPCGCAAGSCTTKMVTWTPTVTRIWSISATDPSIGDGGGNDDTFRNSGIVISGDSMFAINGVHPNPTLTCCYPKSLVRISLSQAVQKARGNAAALAKWSFDASSLGRDVDMEGLTCGADGCASSIYVGDEYCYVYKLTLGVAGGAAAVGVEWDLRDVLPIIGNVPVDKGIEALAYASSTGLFYAGIQQTSTVHALFLCDPTSASGPPPDCSYTAPSPLSIKPPLAPSAAANGVPVARAAAWHVSLVVGTLTLAFCYYSY